MTVVSPLTICQRVHILTVRLPQPLAGLLAPSLSHNDRLYHMLEAKILFLRRRTASLKKVYSIISKPVGEACAQVKV